jgi:gas vesicle protein
MENNKSKILWGLAIGAAIGCVIGYLLSGKK